jgi:hypothetical protein
MPGLNGTGPQGQGPLTGRGMGYCQGAAGAGAGAGFGRGMGRGMGFGRGRGFRNRVMAPPAVADDRLGAMEAQLAALQQELTALRQQHENSDHQR